jgi:hypothetical protein
LTQYTPENSNISKKYLELAPPPPHPFSFTTIKNRKDCTITHQVEKALHKQKKTLHNTFISLLKKEMAKKSMKNKTNKKTKNVF